MKLLINWFNTMNTILSILVIGISFTFMAPANSAESDVWIARLITANWTPAAAQAVITINENWFTQLSQQHPREFDRILRSLSALSRYPNWLTLLESHPEIAGLAIGAENPRLLYRVLTATSKKCWPYILQQYSYLAAPSDAAALTVALENYSRSICSLAQAGIPGAAAVFIFDTTRSGAKEYAAWLEHDLLKPALRNSVDLAEVVTFAITQGPQLRERLATHPQLRQRLPELWQALQRAINTGTARDEKLALITTETKIWDLLLLAEGEAILQKWGPAVPIALLFGPMAMPPDLHPVVVRALYQGHTSIVDLLQRHLGEQNLYNLMRRSDLDAYQIERILNALEGTCPDCPTDYTDRLAYFARLSPTAIQSQFAPPPTGIVTWIPYHNELITLNKVMLGREVTATEWAMLGVGVAMLAVPGSLLLQGSKTVAKQTAAQSAKIMVQGLKSPTTQELAKQLFKNMSPHLTQVTQLLPKIFSDTLKQQIMPFVKKNVAQIEKLTQINITAPVQWIFETTGIGRQSFKHLTGLEARVIMREDAKVFIYPTRISYIYIQYSVQKKAVNVIKNMLDNKDDKESKSAIESSNTTTAEIEWQHNASQWWLLNGAGLIMNLIMH